MRIAYRDVDRAPYLHVLREAAAGIGLAIGLEKADFRTDYPALLLSGAVDVLAENYWGLQSLAAQGQPLVSIATTVTHLNETLFVHPAIATLDDLRGKRLAMRGQGPSELIARLWLANAGPADMDGVVISESELGRWGNWKAILRGDCHAAFVTNFHRREPLDAGLRVLDVPRFGFLGNITLTTLIGTIETRRADVALLVRAMHEASHIFRQDRARTLAIMRGEPSALMGISDDGDLVRLYEILCDELAPEPVPTLDAIGNTHRMRLSASPELGAFNPLLMWDLSFAREASALQRQTPGKRAGFGAAEAELPPLVSTQ